MGACRNLGGWRVLDQDVLEGQQILLRHAHEKVAGRMLGDPRLDFVRQRCVHQRNRRQQREPRAQRQRDGAREARRAADICKRQRQLGPFRALDRLCCPANDNARTPEKRENAKDRGAGDGGDPVLLRQRDGRGGKQPSGQEGRPAGSQAAAGRGVRWLLSRNSSAARTSARAQWATG